MSSTTMSDTTTTNNSHNDNNATTTTTTTTHRRSPSPLSNFKLSSSCDPILSEPTQGASSFEQLVHAIQTGNHPLFLTAWEEFNSTSPNQHSFLSLLLQQDGTGATLLHLAAEYARFEMFSILLRSSIQFHLDLQHGTLIEKNTPLHLCLMNLHDAPEEDVMQCVQALVQAKVKFNVLNKDQLTPLQVAKTTSLQNFAQRLQSQLLTLDAKDCMDDEDEDEEEEEENDD